MQTGATTLVNVTPNGMPPNQDFGAQSASLSYDGRYIAFESDDSSLVPGDTNSASDIFVRDTVIGTTRRVSLTSTGTQLDNWASTDPSISADGQTVAYVSRARGLTGGADNGFGQIDAYNMRTGTTTWVTRPRVKPSSQDSSRSPSISGDGRFITFDSLDTSLVAGGADVSNDVFLADLANDTISVVTKTGPGLTPNILTAASYNSAISADGVFVTFGSSRADLAPVHNGQENVFLFNTATHEMQLLSDSVLGSSFATPAISADGRFVVYEGAAYRGCTSTTKACHDPVEATAERRKTSGSESWLLLLTFADRGSPGGAETAVANR